MSKQTKFQIGDTVTWTSQAGGNAKTKTGKIIGAILPQQRLRDAIDLDEWRMAHHLSFAKRDHESYLIQVGKSKRLYWPLVKYLKPVEPSPHNCE